MARSLIAMVKHHFAECIGEHLSLNIRNGVRIERRRAFAD
jgi:hypothetical protein